MLETFNIQSYTRLLQKAYSLNIKATRYVLSVDGGGIRGILPAIILTEIEKTLKKPIAAIFDLMAGTSTGGILVAGLTMKDSHGNSQYSAMDMTQLYQEQGPYIFKPSYASRLGLSWFSSAQYTDKNIEAVFERYFGDEILKNTANQLLITSYDLQNNCPFFFKSWKKSSQCLKIKDALRATIALPTYFTPKFLKVDNIDRVLIDGGILANNPAVCAYASAKKLFPNEKIVLLSLGTGKQCSFINYKKINDLGKIGWFVPLLDISFTSNLELANYQMVKFLGDNYLRIQPQLTDKSLTFDNISKKSFKNLQTEAIAMLKYNQKVLKQFYQMRCPSQQEII